MVDTLNLKFFEPKADHPCSFCFTIKLGRVVIVNTPREDCFICAECIDDLSAHLKEIRAALADPTKRN